MPAATRALLVRLVNAPWLRSWYLAGGSALALHYGHRSSRDLDFFSRRRTFDAESVILQASRLGRWVTTARDEGTLYGTLRGVRVSFIAYPWFVPGLFNRAGSLPILKADDLAVMKVMAIAQRGRRRDFVDLYTYCQHGHALGDVLRRVPRKYGGRCPDVAHLLRSLVFFGDAEKDPLVRLVPPASWKAVTAFFEREVRSLARGVFRL